MASITFGEGGYGFSFVLSLIRPFIFGCSPGTYACSFRTRGRTSEAGFGRLDLLTTVFCLFLARIGSWRNGDGRRGLQPPQISPESARIFSRPPHCIPPGWCDAGTDRPSSL